MRITLLLGTSIAAMSAVSAQAQTATSDSDRIPEIIITATKTESTLQRTPQAITALEAGDLARAGVTGVQDLNKLVGGLQIEQNGSNAAIYIRGVGSRSLSPGNDPAVAFSVDGVYYARSSGIGTTLFDVSRVEVVKGPQGTLYGRNATGGAVNVITNRPKIGVRGLDGEIEVGNYSAIRTVVGVNLPIGDVAAVRLAAQSVYREGYLSDGYDDANMKSVRASVLYSPSPAFSLYISGDYAHQGGQGPGTVPVGPGGNNNALPTRFAVPNAPYTGPSDPRINAVLAQAAPASALSVVGSNITCVGIPFPPGSRPPSVVGVPALLTCANPIGVPPIDANGYLNNQFYGANVTADLDVGIGRLTAIGGYRQTEIDTRFRVDPGAQRSNASIKQYSAEMRLASKPESTRLKWLVGAFYLKEDQAVTSNVPRVNSAISNPLPSPGSPLPASVCVAPLGPPPGTPGLCVARATVVQTNFIAIDPDLANQTYAGFGQATFSIVDGLRITGGVRYTHEKKSQAPAPITAYYLIPAGVTTSYTSQGSTSYSNWSYRAGAEFDLGRSAMVYATYSTAFHAGGFNLGVRQGPNKYEFGPEYVKSYVAGLKSRFWDNRIQFNVEAFLLDYDNYQQNNFGRVNDGSTACSVLAIQAACPLTLRTENAATARIRGVETDIVFAPVRNTTFDVNILYNNAKFRQFRLSDAFTGAVVNYDGRRLPGAVPWTVTGGVSQVFPLDNGGRIIADAHSQYKSGAFLWFTNIPSMYQKGYTRTDLSLTYEAPENKVSITGFVRNVENKAALLQGGPTDATTGLVWTNLIAPRTYGAMVQFHF